jgi:hypothetical protein
MTLTSSRDNNYDSASREYLSIRGQTMSGGNKPYTLTINNPTEEEKVITPKEEKRGDKIYATSAIPIPTEGTEASLSVVKHRESDQSHTNIPHLTPSESSL